MKIDLYYQRQNCTTLNVFFSSTQITLILQGVPPLGVYNRNTMGENSYFLALCVNTSKTVRDTSKITIND